MGDLLSWGNLLHHALRGLTYGDFSWAHCDITDIYYRQIIVGFKSIWEYPLKVGKLGEVKKISRLNDGL